jgi:DNA-binding response OmpR family regulator
MRSGSSRKRSPDAKIVAVVDDHVEIREVLAEFLRRLGFVAIPVPDGDSALVVAEKIHLDLVLLDLVLSGTSGTALLSTLRGKLEGTPIVVISGYLNEAKKAECRALGADEVLEKPLNLKNLETIIRGLLRVKA